MQQVNDDIVLARMFGMKISDAEDAIYIAECTKGIRDIGMFIEYCDDHKEGIIAKSAEKLRLLSKRFKALEEEERLKEDRAIGEAWTDDIVRKVAECRATLQSLRSIGRMAGFRHAISPDGRTYFTQKQLMALAEVSSNTDVLIELSEIGSLHDELMKVYMARFKKKAAYMSLGSNAKKVMQLASSIKTA